MIDKEEIKMNYMFSDKYDIKNYLKEEEEYKKEKKSMEDYCKYIEQLEESTGNLSACIDKIEVRLKNIKSILLSAILLSASGNRKISKKLYKEIMGEMDCIKEYINEVDEDR